MNTQQESLKNLGAQIEKDTLTEITQELEEIDTLIRTYDREEQARLHEEEAENILLDPDTL